MKRQNDLDLMARALQLARHGEGFVEPNPMVGCVVARDGSIVGEGWHARYGGDHAEVEALRSAGAAAHGASLYVTLEPCCHQGKTPPCAPAIVEARLARVVVAQRDPFPRVDGGGIRQLEEAGIAVEVGLLQEAALDLNAPYHKLLAKGRPWVLAKWAMTLDGKLATRTGDSQWISNARSRTLVHQLRGRVDAILVGGRTAAADDPSLTARPPGPRTATRIVLDSRCELSDDQQLVRTAREVPVLVVAGPESSTDNCRRLREAGCEVLVAPESSPTDRIAWLLDELGRQRMTNVLVEGGGRVLGAFLDAREIDEVHVFIAPKLIGGAEAVTPCGGLGLSEMGAAVSLVDAQLEDLDGDAYWHGRVERQADQDPAASSPNA